MDSLFVDGELVEVDAVSLPVDSRGLAFGFGVFETMKFLEGNPCFFGDHVDRLKRAVAGAGLEVRLDERELRACARRLFRANEVLDGVFKIVISDRKPRPVVAMFVKSRGVSSESPAARLRSSPVRKASKAFTSRHKSLNYMESVLELERAAKAGFDECVFRNEDGFVTECAIANLFWIREGVLKTPALECGLLDGIVRSKVIVLAKSLGMRVEEGRFCEAELLQADEAFLTSSGKGPRSVARFEASTGASKEYAIELLPRIRAAYLELEREEALQGYE